MRSLKKAHTVITQMTLLYCEILCDEYFFSHLDKISYFTSVHLMDFFNLSVFISCYLILLPFLFFFLFTATLSLSPSLCFILCFLAVFWLPPPSHSVSLPGCLQHYANTFKGSILLCSVILQRSHTPLIFLWGLRFLLNWSISGMTPAPRLNQGHTLTAHTHLLLHAFHFTWHFTHLQIPVFCDNYLQLTIHWSSA